jgi:putative ABC transport system permease protein
MIDGLRQDLRLSARQIARSPGFAASVVLTVGLGIGVNAVVFSFVSGVLLAPFPFRQPGDLVALREAGAERELSPSFANYADWAAQARSFSAMGAARVQDASLSGPGGAERVAAARMTASLLVTLGVDPILGRTFTAEEDRVSGAPVVLLGHGVWVRRFGADAGVVGRSTVLDGRAVTVVGVMPPGFRFPAVAEVWTPMAEALVGSPRGQRNLSVVARLRGGVSIAEARAEMAVISARLSREHPAENRDLQAVVLPLRDLYVRQGRPALYAMAAAVAFVLGVACLNVANLLLSRGAGRAAEMAMRVALGARRRRLVRQLLTESVVLALLGGALGLLLSAALTRAVIAAIPVPLPFWMQIGTDARVLAFAAGVSVLTGLAFGLAPALQATRVDIGSLLKAHAAGSRGGGRRLRQGLVIGEIALSVVLLACAGALARSFARLQRVDPGFHAEGVLTAQLAPLPEARYPGSSDVAAFYDGLLERVRVLPGVVAAAANSQIPLQQAGGTEAGLTIAGRGDLRLKGNLQVVTPGYFRALGIPLARGREFARSDGSRAAGVAVVNERLAARAWPGQEPLGKGLSLNGPGGPWLEVVGVAGDVRHRGLDREALHDVYLAHAQSPSRAMTLVVRTEGEPASLAAGLRQAVGSLDRDQPLHRVRTMRQAMVDSLWVHRFNARLFLCFSIAAAAMAAVGLYGVVACSAAQRTREIGIRMALGASSHDVRRLVLREGVRVLATALAVGLPAAAAATRGLAAALHGVAAWDPLVLLAVALVLAPASLAACYLPARRASNLLPLPALGHDGGSARPAAAAGTGRT